ncbi:something about silencing protein 10 [Phalaenopsis equestris]|uniref:something about silencing protein 10 n=1 Tax=Phalaenopsis equestris TaxID=78828 RepID=UPI0009E64818|nr:something about silencing protein 10 [Phalaenopsis equestris]XP_020585728.1 something about silencing protein 10 [Phalaenopsis equestris]XP_020585729.1 something about silencing protein 10 [Phalaenopsis equestris]XP_020585730.1 something about silencing protein 10 [Phalaenopsis equestris]
MGKRSKKRGRTPKLGKAYAQEDDAYMEKEVDDEIDAFHKQREMILLDVNKDAGDSDDDLEEPVFDLEDHQNGDSYNDRENDDEEDEDEDDDEDSGDFDDVKDKGFSAKIIRQAKYLKEKFGGGEDEMSDDDEQDEERKTVWGRKKNLYYSADNIDYELQSSDEDLPMEEEAEVLKIQREKAKTLEMEDFGLADSDKEMSDFDGEEKLFQELGKGAVAQKTGVDVDGITIDGYEEIKKNINALSKVEQMDVVYSAAPELVSLLSELNTAVDQLKQVKPFACKVIKEEKDQRKGMDYLELKQVVLLIYCQTICFYLLLKSEGHPVRDHPVIARLVEIKNLLEKMSQISSRFPSQSGDVDSHTYSTNKSDEENVSLELEPDVVDMSAKASTVSEITGLLKDSSVDVDSKTTTKKLQDSQLDLKSIQMMKIRENLELKLKQKGIYTHIQGKVDNSLKDLTKPINGNHVIKKDFDVEVTQAKQHGPDNSHQGVNKLAQAVVSKAQKWKVISGDDDLPKRDDIAERRRKHELRVLARAGVTSMDDGDEAYDDPGINTVGTDLQENEELDSEDEFYRKVKKQRAEKLTAKAELYSRAHATPTAEPEADGKRQITRQIEKNRGLTRNRKKLTKNPRKKYKIKHQKAVVRRKGQVRDIRKPSGPYGGEATGINTNVSRSIRFKS